MKTNPRFVWLIGAIHEQFPDVPHPDHSQGGDVILWDRQEKRTAMTLAYDYAQAFCLEGNTPESGPFTNLENWFNNAGNDALESENLTPTNPEYQTDEMPKVRTQNQTRCADGCKRWQGQRRTQGANAGTGESGGDGEMG